jgi:hypothetical protein
MTKYESATNKGHYTQDMHDKLATIKSDITALLNNTAPDRTMHAVYNNALSQIHSIYTAAHIHYYLGDHWVKFPLMATAYHKEAGGDKPTAGQLRSGWALKAATIVIIMISKILAIETSTKKTGNDATSKAHRATGSLYAAFHETKKDYIDLEKSIRNIRKKINKKNKKEEEEEDEEDL